MFKVSAVLLFLFLLFPPSSHSQRAKKHPIDKALEDCIAKDSSTAGMTNCTYKAQEMWDQELNKVYNGLASRLEGEGKEALKAAQLEWMKYRDTEYKLIDAIYSPLKGTMYIPMRASERMEIVKKRAMELRGHLELVKEQ